MVCTLTDGREHESFRTVNEVARGVGYVRGVGGNGEDCEAVGCSRVELEAGSIVHAGTGDGADKRAVDIAGQY